MLVVYLSNRYIRVVDGEVSGSKVNVRAMYYSVDTRGCILNGTVMDVEGFTELIRDLWDSNHLPRKGVSLVIDSNQFTTKVTDVPLQKQKQMMQFVSREFTDVERTRIRCMGIFRCRARRIRRPRYRRYSRPWRPLPTSRVCGTVRAGGDQRGEC